MSHAKHPMRVARVITRLNIGGPSIQAVRLTTDLDHHGFVTTLFHGRLGEEEGDMSYLIPAGTDARFIDALCRPISPVNDLRALMRLYREFRSVRPVVVHTHMAKAGMVGRTAALLYNLTRGSAPRAAIVHTYHGHVLEGYFSQLTTTLFINIERLLARISDRIIAISPAIRDDLHLKYRIGHDTQYRVVPLGFDLAPFAAIDDASREQARQALQIPRDAVVVSTVGRLTAIKQPRLYLDTMKRVIGAHANTIALIAGDGELRNDIASYASALGISDHVRMLGWRRDLPVIHGATDVFLLTSRNEGTPVALIESMASAVPGVSTNVGGVKDVINSESVGLLAPDGDAALLADHVIRLLGDPQRRRRMGAAARAFVLQRFGIERLVADIVTVYEELALNRP